MVQPWPESLVSSPGPSSWQVPNSSFPLARLLKTEMIFRGFLLLLFSLQSSYTRSSGNVLKGNPAVCWRPPHVSTTNFLVSLSPDSQLLPGPQMGEHLSDSTHSRPNPSAALHCLYTDDFCIFEPSLFCWTEVLVCCKFLDITCNNRYIFYCNCDKAVKEKNHTVCYYKREY